MGSQGRDGLEVRLGDEARLTKDLDLGLRDEVDSGADLQDRLIDALTVDADGDGFIFSTGPPTELRTDNAGQLTWRLKLAATLAGKPFGGIQLDVSPRVHELDATDYVALPNSLAFAGIPTPTAEIIDVNRHAAEKFHAMARTYGERENSRVRDLVDLVILIEHDLLDPSAVRAATERVWRERDAAEPPFAIEALPESWPPRYELLAAENDLATQQFDDAISLISRFWAEARGF
jgi:hypothetical protein